MARVELYVSVDVGADGPISGPYSMLSFGMFGHSRHLDVKSLYAARSGAMVTQSTRRQMPTALMPSRPHPHNALDDALEQAELFQNLFRWGG